MMMEWNPIFKDKIWWLTLIPLVLPSPTSPMKKEAQVETTDRFGELSEDIYPSCIVTLLGEMYGIELN